MTQISEFEEKVKEIFYFIAEHGWDKKPLNIFNPDTITEQDKTEFRIQVHKGFRIGQSKILDLIIPLLTQQKDAAVRLAKARQERDKEKSVQLTNELNLVKHQVRILRHFADFIAWQNMCGQYHIARRYYSGQKERPDLLNTNLESVILSAHQFHKRSEKNFALITDLTTFVDIGDLLVFGEEKVYVVEVKDGDVQQEVYKFIDEIAKDDFDPKKIDYNNKDQKFFDQTLRTIKQLTKGSRLVNFINTESGKEPFSESEITVFETTADQERYYDLMVDLIDKSKEKGVAFGEVENIILIGMFRGNRIPISKGFMEEVSYHNCPDRFPITDYLSLIYSPIKEPLFFKPFGKEAFFDILFGRLKIYLFVDINALLTLFNQKGLPARWMSRKETHQHIEQRKDGYRPFIHNNQAIEVTVNSQKIVLGDTFMVKLALDNLTPTALANTYILVKTK